MTLEEELAVFYDTSIPMETRLTSARRVIDMLRTTLAITARMDHKQGQPCDHGFVSRPASKGTKQFCCAMCGEDLFTVTYD